MLFGYPVEAIADNWFHDCLFEMLQTIHTSLRSGQEPPSWPTIIPESHRNRLSRRSGIRSRLITYQTTAATLNNSELDQLANALSQQNEVKRLLSGECNCDTIEDLPEAIRQSVKDLFDFAFEKLTDLGLRDCQYQVIYDQTYHVCPFCGCEYFDAPTEPRQDLDHYLVKSKYPFAAANLHNLVPMGSRCNSKYKQERDILYGNNGTRRRSYYPYDHVGIRISLENSEQFAGGGLFPHPCWYIDFEPDSEETFTWDAVFDIRERYKRDILDPDFRSWLREFSSWCRSAHVQPGSEQDVVDALKQYSEHMQAMQIRDRAFLKAAVFQMLFHHCQQGNQRLLELINAVIIGGMN